MAAAKALDPQKIIAEIQIGRHDAYVTQINEAIRRRVMDGQLKLRWRLRYDGLTITEDDLTLDECQQIEDIANTTWSALNPSKSARLAGAVLIVALHSRRGIPLEEAAEKVGALTAVEVDGYLDEYISEMSPLDSDPTEAQT